MYIEEKTQNDSQFVMQQWLVAQSNQIKRKKYKAGDVNELSVVILQQIQTDLDLTHQPVPTDLKQ